MGFAARWLVSIALLVLPIAVTLGVLLGIDGHRKATNQPPLFPHDDGDDQISKHGTTLLTRCDKIGGFGGKAFKTEDRFICEFPKRPLCVVYGANLPVDFCSSRLFSHLWSYVATVPANHVQQTTRIPGVLKMEILVPCA